VRHTFFDPRILLEVVRGEFLNASHHASQNIDLPFWSSSAEFTLAEPKKYLRWAQGKSGKRG
jgi:hypothetical protein